jgi:hypothetical protein
MTARKRAFELSSCFVRWCACDEDVQRAPLNRRRPWNQDFDISFKGSIGTTVTDGF